MSEGKARMPINTSLLVAAPMLQDYLVDDITGLPLANGTITLYQDNSRTTLKNWYYQTGTPGNYTYITLPNPLQLSSVGTIADINGNDTIPFYYPYSEVDNTTPQPYYIVVVNSNGQQQFTRQNFPFVPPTSSTGNTNNTFTNYIINNVFWRNLGSITGTQFASTASTITINGNTYYYVTLAPSQHDGMIMPDILYFKDQTNATETLTFNKFVSSFQDNILTNDVTPEFYLNLNCTGAGTETIKYIQFPIQLHVDNLSGYTQASASIWVQNVGGNPNNTLTLKLLQYLGTGVTSPSSITLKTIVATSSWQKYTVNFTFPTSQNLALGNGGDDAWYLQVGFPTATTTNINIAKPSVFLSQTQPTDEFQNYDYVESIVNSARTGDVRISVNNFMPYGWLKLNDGTIGNASSNATTRANIDTWPLFSLLWNQFKYLDTGSTFNPVCQLYNSSGTAVNYSSTAIADFNANNRLALTKAMGRVFMGGVDNIVSTDQYGQTITGISGNTLTVASTAQFYTGAPVILTTTGTLPGGLSTNTVYYAVLISSTALSFSTTLANAYAGTVITLSGASGSGTNNVFTATTGTTGGQYAHTQLVAELAAHTHPASSSNGTTYFEQVNTGTGTINFSTNVNPPLNNAFFANTGSQGSSSPFNVVQPSTFMNMFMKL